MKLIKLIIIIHILKFILLIKILIFLKLIIFLKIYFKIVNKYYLIFIYFNLQANIYFINIFNHYFNLKS